MRAHSLKQLLCPCCEGDLKLSSSALIKNDDASKGSVECVGCGEQFPILSGVLILTEDVGSYLTTHAKGIARYVEDADIPKKYRTDFLRAKRQFQTEHIEEDLEAERVTALYLMTHYLTAKDISVNDPLLTDLIQKHWNQGPFQKIADWFSTANLQKQSLIELGCGVGGLLPKLGSHLSSYLGLDSSFSSLVLARQFALGLTSSSKQIKFKVPDDLLRGSLAREVSVPAAKPAPRSAEFVVCDLACPPVKKNAWQMAVALNVIDMVDDPGELARLQYSLLTRGGTAIQSSPYVWHPQVAENLRAQVPASHRASDKAVEWLYKNVGFTINKALAHVPWLFFKHSRQLEVYSVHMLWARKDRSNS